MNIKYFRGTAGGLSNVVTQQMIDLQPRQIRKITIPAGTSIRVRRGLCWLTASGQYDDIILQPGQVWHASRKTELLLSALDRRACELEIG